MAADPDLMSELETAVAHGSAERRATILRRITDLFISASSRCSDREIALFDEVISCLIKKSELQPKALLAVRLASVQNAPSKTMRLLAFDDSADVACPVLAESEQLDDQTLVENASKKSQQYLLAISRRRRLTTQVTDVLVEWGNREVVLSTVGNTGAMFSDQGFATLVKRSEDDEELTKLVAARADIPSLHLLQLLSRATQFLRFVEA
jgi:uncharacterized protein (DUF2336 family)